MSVADDKFFGPLRAVDIASIQAKSKARGFGMVITAVREL